MPFGAEGVEPGIALALSGGGFRATLFHCGALCRLDELGVLSRLDRISSVSGGSITAGVLAARWSALQFEGGVAKDLRELVILPLQAFCRRTVDVPAIGLGTLLPGRRPSDLLQAEYAEHLYGATTLQDLPDRPRFVFNATNLATGVSFRFSKPYAGDYRIVVRLDDGTASRWTVTSEGAFARESARPSARPSGGVALPSRERGEAQLELRRTEADAIAVAQPAARDALAVDVRAVRRAEIEHRDAPDAVLVLPADDLRVSR